MSTMEQKTGMLSLCATPIGNLEDITLRVLRTLEQADAVWAEDTRHTLRLLNHLELKKPLLSCHEHNERERTELVTSAIRQGQRIAYCSDAGMPGISDPGALLLRACQEAGLPCEVLPGPSAVPMAAVLCGLPCEKFTFYGFLPREKKPRQQVLEQIQQNPYLSIVFESPVRVPCTLKELAGKLGADRPAALLRELTKVHEDCVKGTLESLSLRYQEPPKGECVLAIGGCEKKAPEAVDETQLHALLERLLAQGLPLKAAAQTAANTLGISKKEAYQAGLALKEGR